MKSELLNTKEDIKKVLNSLYWKLHRGGAQYIGDSLNTFILSEDQITRAKLRVLHARMSSYDQTVASFTVPLLIQHMHEKLGKDDIHFETCCLPEPKDRNLFKKNKVPLMFGYQTKRPALGFDIIAFSHSVTLEGLNLPGMLKESGIPCWFEERMEDDTIPLILMGGVMMGSNEWLLGSKTFKKEGDELIDSGTGLIDVSIVGKGEKVYAEFLKKYIEFRASGKSKRDCIRELGKSSIAGLYAPSQYRARYKGNNLQIVEPICEEIPRTVEASRSAVNLETPLIARPLAVTGEGGVAEIEVAHGCGGFCTFCHEGWINRPYTERSLEDIWKYFKLSRVMNGAHQAKLFAYNWSHFNRIHDLAFGLSKIIGRIKLISNRADIAATNPELIELSRKTGNLTTTLGVEGISARMRHYLSKWLSNEHWLGAVENYTKAGFKEIKFFMMATSLEQQEDIDECVETLDKLVEIRKKYGNKTYYRLSFIPVLNLPFTPLQFQAQLSALHVGEKFLQPIVEKTKQVGIGFRTSLRQFEVEVACLLSTGDRRLTKIIVDAYSDIGLMYDGLVSKDLRDYFEAGLKLQNLTLNDYYREKTFEEFLPWDHISFGVKKSFLWKKFQDAKKFIEQPYCLKTAATPGKCLGCGACKEGFSKTLTERTLSSEHKASDIINRSMVDVNTIRFKIKIEASHRVIPSSARRFELASVFMREYKEGVDIYNVVKQIASSPSSEFDNWSYGSDYIDLSCSKKINEILLRSALAKMNSHLRGWNIVDFRIYSGAGRFNRCSDLVYYRVYVDRKDIPQVEISTKIRDFLAKENKTIKIKTSIQRDVFRIVEVSLTEDSLYGIATEMGMNDKEIVHLLVGERINPYDLLSSVLGRKKHTLLKFPAERVDFYKKERSEENSLFALFDGGKSSCSCGAVIERDLFGTFVSENKCILCNLEE